MAELIIVAVACLAIGFILGVVTLTLILARAAQDYDMEQHRRRA